MSTGSPDACLTASSVGTSKDLLRVESQSFSPDQPAADKATDEALHTVSLGVVSPHHVYTASNDISPTLLQRNLDSRDPTSCQPDSEQQADPIHAELETNDSTHTLADSDALEGQHTRPGTRLVSEPVHSLQDAAVVAEPVSRSADDLTLSEPPSESTDAVVLSEPANSLPGTSTPRSGSESSNHTQHVTPHSDLAEPSVRGSPPQEFPTTSLSQQVVSAQDDSPKSSEAGLGTDAIPRLSSPHSEQLTATSGTDTDRRPNTAGFDSPHTEQQAAAIGTDAGLRPSTVGSDGPHSEQLAATSRTDPDAGPCTAGSDSPHTGQQAVGTEAVPGLSTAGFDSPRTERQATANGTVAVPELSSAGYDSPQVERQSSSAAASTSGADEATPGQSMSAQKAEAQKGISVNAIDLPCWVLLGPACRGLLVVAAWKYPVRGCVLFTPG